MNYSLIHVQKKTIKVWENAETKIKKKQKKNVKSSDEIFYFFRFQFKQLYMEGSVIKVHPCCHKLFDNYMTIPK